MNLETVGRVLLNAWRIAREELKSTNYDLQNMVYTVFNHRIPVFSDWTLTLMFDESLQRRAYVLDYMVQRVKFTENFIEVTGPIKPLAIVIVLVRVVQVGELKL